MNLKRLSVLAFAALALLLSSCTTFKFSGAQITKEIPSYTVVGDFMITVNVNKFLGASGGATLFNVASDATDAVIYDAIQREISKYTGDAAVNVTIEYQASFLNLLCNGLTASLWAPATAIVSGKIVKYTK
jgi:hypothetical protein